VSSETTAAQAGAIGNLRRDPFAMLPFCGYNMGDYFAHWLNIGAKADADKLPKIFYVNWFRKNDAGKFIWPGFGENSRVLEWVVGRIAGSAGGVETPIGIVPTRDALNLEGLEIPDADLDTLLAVDLDVWRQEAALIPGHFETFDNHLPAELWTQYEGLLARLETAGARLETAES